jgi:transcription initiation factor TFIID subunit 1, fungi type
LRSFHRPTIHFPVNVPLHFTKVRSAKKKKDKHGRKIDLAQAMQTTGDLSLRDTSSFILWEYSEEAPPVMNNLGMGSVLVNYYRKRHDNDDSVPKVQCLSHSSFGVGELICFSVSLTWASPSFSTRLMSHLS